LKSTIIREICNVWVYLVVGDAVGGAVVGLKVGAVVGFSVG